MEEKKQIIFHMNRFYKKVTQNFEHFLLIFLGDLGKQKKRKKLL